MPSACSNSTRPIDLKCIEAIPGFECSFNSCRTKAHIRVVNIEELTSPDAPVIVRQHFDARAAVEAPAPRRSPPGRQFLSPRIGFGRCVRWVGHFIVDFLVLAGRRASHFIVVFVVLLAVVAAALGAILETRLRHCARGFSDGFVLAIGLSARRDGAAGDHHAPLFAFP